MHKRISLFLTVSEGVFTKTRNFKTDHIYSIEHIDFSCFDEIIIVSVDDEINSEYFEFVKEIALKINVPLVLSGKINSLKDAKRFFNLGADRIILNYALWDNPELVKKISSLYGKQAVILSIDFVDNGDEIVSYDWRKKSCRDVLIPENMDSILPYIGEILLQDVERDGKVIGANISKLNKVIDNLSLDVPFHIGSCGIVSWAQYAELLKQDSIDAVTVSNIHHMSEKANRSLRDWCIIEKLNIRIPCKFAESV